MGKSDSFNKKTSITTSNINTAYSGTLPPHLEGIRDYKPSHNIEYSGPLPPALEQMRGAQKTTTPEPIPIEGPTQDGPFLTLDSVAGQVNNDKPRFGNTAYAESQTSGGTGFREAQTNTTVFQKTPGSSGIYETPSGHKTTKNLDKNPHLGKKIDFATEQSSAYTQWEAAGKPSSGTSFDRMAASIATKNDDGEMIPINPITGAKISQTAPKKGQWFEVTSTHGDLAGSKMWISENKKLNAQGLQNVLNNQAADRRFNTFLKTEWRSVYTTNLSNVSGIGWDEKIKSEIFGKIDSWNVSESKKKEFKKDMKKRVENLNFAWNPSGSLPKGVKDKKGPGKSSKANPLTSWGGWDSKKIQKGKFAIGGYDIAANPNKYDQKKLDHLKKLSDPNYSY